MFNQNYTTELLNLEEVIITKVENISGQLHIHLHLPRKEHVSPRCGAQIDRVHDYREQIVKDIRPAQYETGTRTPKADLTAALASALDVSPQTLAVPDIDSYTGLMHTLVALEDRYGLQICESYGEVRLRVDVRHGKDAAELHKMLCAWRQVPAMLKAGEISQEEYDRWRYRYPEFDTTQRWAKVPSQELSDMLIGALKEDEE